MDESEIARAARDALKSILESLAKGNRYYDSVGRRLTTPKEILECLTREHKVRIQTNEPNSAIAPNTTSKP
jgi:hypothetical protein